MSREGCKVEHAGYVVRVSEITDVMEKVDDVGNACSLVRLVQRESLGDHGVKGLNGTL